jgi:L-ectoine synthase
MIITSMRATSGTSREVSCPVGGFTSHRLLLERDMMGFSMHRTIIPEGPPQRWHYKHHLEACYCLIGRGILTEVKTGVGRIVTPGTVYALDKNDEHTFQALIDTELLCVFNPPIVGNEIHANDGSYPTNGGTCVK